MKSSKMHGYCIYCMRHVVVILPTAFMLYFFGEYAELLLCKIPLVMRVNRIFIFSL